MVALQLLIIFAALLLGVESQYNTYKVNCTYKNSVCECPLTDDAGNDVDVCEFSGLDIEHLQTFTRYEVTDDGVRGDRGGVWYIERISGKFMWLPIPPEVQANPPCNSTIAITDSACTQPSTVDGMTFRSFIGVNGQIPGPTLIVNHRQAVVIPVRNRLASESISIHWHGMHQRNTNFMDGVEHVTQCGIPPGSNFTYIFQADPAGTTWYHSHSGAQRTDGLFGSLIVRENPKFLMDVKNELGEFEDDPANHTLSFLDWQRESSIDLFTKVHSTLRLYTTEDASKLQDITVVGSTRSLDDAEVGVVPYWSGLINGKGRHPTVDYYQTRLSIFNVSASTTYRFRLIGAQSLYAYRVSIDNHKLKVIATDGDFIESVEVDYIIIHSGERYDFLLETKTTLQLPENMYDFIIRAETLEKDPGYPTFNFAEAILHYKTEINPNDDYMTILARGFAPVTPEYTCNEGNPCKVLNCPFKNYPSSYDCIHIHELNSLFEFQESVLPKLKPEEQLFFNFGFEGVGRTSAINGRNLQLPSSPLVSLRDPDTLCTDLENNTVCDNTNETISKKCMCTHVRNVKSDKSVQLVLSAVGPNSNVTDDSNFLNAHPVHLHGHYFHVVDIQFGEYGADGRLAKANEDIECGGKNVCTNPGWAPNKENNYTAGENGKIRPRAPRKDTLVIPAGGYAVVYFQTDNPGYWFLHCHIEVHQLEGMGVVIREGEEFQKLPDGFRDCGNFDWTVNEYYNRINGGTVLKSTYLLVLIFCSSIAILAGM